MIPSEIALRTTSTVVSASNLTRIHLRYHFIVGRLRQRSSAISLLVCPSAIRRSIVSSLVERFGFPDSMLFSDSMSQISAIQKPKTLFQSIETTIPKYRNDTPREYFNDFLLTSPL